MVAMMGPPAFGKEAPVSSSAFSPNAKLIGHRKFEQLPPVPPGARASFDAQPTGIAVPVFEVRSREELSRGGVASVNATATAIVYKSSADTGFANFNKGTAGNFVGTCSTWATVSKRATNYPAMTC